MNAPTISRLDALLADRATVGLDPSESDELDLSLAATRDADDDAFDRLAAQLTISWLTSLEPMPAMIRERIVRDAADARSRHRGRVMLRWFGAAAAVVAISIAIGVTAGRGAPVTALPTTAVDRCAALEERSGTSVLPWTVRHEGYESVEGAVVWNDDEQQGFMRLRGLAVNDPARGQYQLWIVDSKRDKHPVDGGVFDVTSDDAVVVPIDAKLAVTSPQAFAITLEKPGGVVVSSGPLLVVAPNGG